jgi:hypothetical protein
MSDLVRGGLADPTLVQPAQIAAVYQERRGALLAADLAPTDTYVEVDDTDGFVDDGGAISVESADDVFIPADPTEGTPAFSDRPNTEGVRYVEVDRDLNRLVLADPWDATFPSFVVGDSVWVDPPSVEIRADVALDGDPGQVVSARVPYALQQSIPQGLRIEGQGEWVRVALTEQGESFEVVDVLGEPPLFDPTVIATPETEEVTYGTVTADVVESPSVPRRSPVGLTLYVNQANGDDENGGEALFPLLDTFTRVVASGYGTSDSGHTYTTPQNQGNLSDVDGSDARIRLNAGNQNTIVRSSFAPLDVELTTQFTFSGLPTAGSVWGGLLGRIVDGTTTLGIFVTTNNSGVAALNIDEKVNGTWATVGALSLGTFTGAAFAAIDWKLRVQLVTNPDGGTDVFAKLWQSTATEPDDWSLTVNTASAAGLQSAGGTGFGMRSGAAYTGSVTCRFRDLAATTIGGDGLTVDLAEGGVGPLRSIAAALAKVGDWVEGDCRIILGGTIEEDVEIAGMGGGGSLVIDGGSKAATLFGYVRVRGMAAKVELQRLNIIDSGTVGPAGTVTADRGSGYLLVQGCAIDAKQASTGRINVVMFTEGSRGRVEDNDLMNGASRALYSVNASAVYATDNRGSPTPTSYQATCGVIFVNGSKPSNATNTTIGGQIFGTTSSNAGGTAPPDPEPTKKSFSATANATKTWRPEWAWKSGDDTIQGEYAGSGGLSRGCAFYGTKLRRTGAPIAISGKVYIRRAGSGGQSGKQDIYLATHPLEKVPSNDSGPGSGVNGPSRVGALGYGEGAWFSIPKGWVQDLLNGPARGLMVYHGSANPYVICQGRSKGAGIWKVTITYKT